MVQIMENPIKMDDLGGKPHYFPVHIQNDAIFEGRYISKESIIFRIYVRFREGKNGDVSPINGRT